MLRQQPVVFSTWRMVHGLLKEHPGLFTEKHFAYFLASVTSHSTIGGGLDPLNPIPGRTPEEAYTLAVNLLDKFKVVTVNSKILYDLLKPGLPKILYCPNGVDITFFKPKQSKKFNPSKIKIGWVGKERGPKNFTVIQKALAQLESSGGFEIKIVHIKKGLNSVILTDSDMKIYYNSIDFYLCASWNEGTPNPALEAGASGVPIITTRVGNMPEIIKDGENGYFIEPTVESIVAQFDALRSMDSKSYENMSCAIRKTIESNWTWSERIKNFQTAYDALLKK